MHLGHRWCAEPADACVSTVLKAADTVLILLHSHSCTGKQEVTLPTALVAPDIKGHVQLHTTQGQHVGCSTCRQVLATSRTCSMQAAHADNRSFLTVPEPTLLLQLLNQLLLLLQVCHVHGKAPGAP